MSPSHQPITHHASGALDFVDANDIRWTVLEIARMDFSERVMALLPHPERRQGWLLFESQFGDRRRYTPIPPDWRKLSTAALQQCLADALPAAAGEQRRQSDLDR